MENRPVQSPLAHGNSDGSMGPGDRGGDGDGDGGADELRSAGLPPSGGRSW